MIALFLTLGPEQARQSDITLANNSFSANLPSTSVTSFVGRSGATPPTPTSGPNPLCRADVAKPPYSGDPSYIDEIDLVQVLGDWGGPPTLTENDITWDGKVNSLDLDWVIKAWGTDCSW